MKASSSSGANTPPGFHRQRKYQILFIILSLALVIGSIFIWYKYFYPQDSSHRTESVDKEKQSVNHDDKNPDRRKRSFTSRDQEKMAQEAFQKEGVVPDVIDVAPKIKAEVRFKVYCYD